MIDVGGHRTERQNWFLLFENCDAILFIVSCAEFDLNVNEEQPKNRHSESLRVFKKVWQDLYNDYKFLIIFDHF